MEDQHLNTLYDNMINSRYEYLKYLEKIYIPKFNEEAKGLVLDTTHEYYKYLFGINEYNKNNENNENHENYEKCKQIYHKLALIAHPDKCKEEWSDKIFQIINDYFTKCDLINLEKLFDHWTKYQSFTNYETGKIPTRKERILLFERSLWYLWYNNDYIIKKLFITPEELVIKENKLNNRIKQLECDNQKSRDLLKRYE